VLYSLIGAAKLNGIDPEAYLQNVNAGFGFVLQARMGQGTGGF
jgi:hypothetical protein